MIHIFLERDTHLGSFLYVMLLISKFFLNDKVNFFKKAFKTLTQRSEVMCGRAYHTYLGAFH